MSTIFRSSHKEKKRMAHYLVTCFRYCVNEKGERITVIGIILSVLKALLAENQPYRDFNVAQLRDIEALDKVLFMCKVRVKPFVTSFYLFLF